VTETSTTKADLERALAQICFVASMRDSFIIEAYEAGVTKMRIHKITGVSRPTIDRILRGTR